MLQAESSYARDWRAADFDDITTGSRVVRKTVYKVNNKRKLLIKLGLVLFGYALLLVYLCIKSATLGYQIETLQADIQNIQTANNRLDYQIAEKSSLARVEQVAIADLGMYKPDDKASIPVEVTEDQTGSVQVASAPAAADENKTLSQKILNTMYNSLSHLAQK